MVELMTDEEGNLKSYNEWVKEAEPISDHMNFWETVLPIDHPFWSSHRPGNRLGCQCSLEATDEPPTREPDSGYYDAPSPGLDNNPAKSGEIFTKSQPYFPKSCNECPFNEGQPIDTPMNKAGDCSNCEYLRSCLPKNNTLDFVTTTLENGATIKISKLVKTNDSDYDKLIQIAKHFAMLGENITLTPKKSRPQKFDYECFYKSLIGTKYEGNCPDLLVGDKWYEHEGFIPNDPVKAFRNMMTHGLKQSNRLIIDKPDLTERYMLRNIWLRTNRERQDIEEVWTRETSGEISLLYKKQMANENH